ncbi:hypothetical protein MXD95_016585 [Frankia sp. AiPa1]|nr:hypothetical protein [Frankia sp. AiPa1]
MVTTGGRPGPGDHEGLPGQRLGRGGGQGATRPDLVRPDLVHPDVARPDGGHPGSVRPDLVRPDAGRGGSGQPGAGRSGGGRHAGGGRPVAPGGSSVAGLGALRRLGTLTVGMALLAGLLVWLYGTSVTSMRPRNLPILTVGPQPAAGALADQISRVEPGALSVRTVGSVVAADQALRDRDAYAAIVIGDGGLTLRVASAASPAVTEALTRGIRVFMPGLVIPVVDVVPTAPRDQGGGGLAAGYLPLVLVLAAAGVLLTRLVRSRAARLAAISVFSVLAGFAGAVALRGALHVLPGSLLTTMSVVTLLALAVVAPVVGAGAVAGVAGLVGVVLVMVVGSALSAAASAPEMLPRPWGEVGQFAPPGAGATLLRSTDYFDGAAGGRPVAVLAAWLLVGLWLAFVGGRGAAPEAGTRRPGDGQPEPRGSETRRPVRAADPRAAVPSGSLPAAAPSDVVPSRAVPSRAVPSRAVPFRAVPFEAVPADADEANPEDDAGAAAVPGRRSALDPTVPLEPPPAGGPTGL